MAMRSRLTVPPVPLLDADHAQALKAADQNKRNLDREPGFHGERLLATANPQAARDRAMRERVHVGVQSEAAAP